MRRTSGMSARQRLVSHVQELERLEEARKKAAADLRDAFQVLRGRGFDTPTLKVVLKLRKMTPEQRRERRNLEAIYLASLGMLEGDPLTDEARRRLDGANDPPPPNPNEPTLPGTVPPPSTPPEAAPVQTPLIQRDPAEARAEGEAAAGAGKRIYDNPYRAGDPCRAAWDEGWCAQQQSHGMETPAAYQRRTAKPPETDAKDPKDAGDPGKKGDA